ncbi:MAG: DUF819 family protein [Bacteroidales bacterium]|nr:DUF819 family protein [Bacteroidales bacterium]
MTSKIILVLFYVLSPIVILQLNHKYKFINKLGAVVVAYIVGIVAGNIGIIPESGKQIQEIITMVTIPLAIPLLLFSSDIRQWFTLAGKTALSMLFGMLSVVIMVFAGFFIFRHHGMDELWKIGGMLIGVYTGGTPNLASLKIMLNINDDIYLLTHTYDMILSGIYFLFLISLGQRFFLIFLKPFKFSAPGGKMETHNPDGENPFTDIFKKKTIIPLLKALGLSVLIFAAGGRLSMLVPENNRMVVVILTITSLGIAGSLLPKINKTEKTFELGMYLILIFSVVVASMVDINALAGKTPALFSYLAVVIFGSLILHVIFARIFKIDSDTVIVTSTALICSPPFVPVVAGALRNREIVVSGLTVGIVGYAIGNYLGFLVAEALKLLG